VELARLHRELKTTMVYVTHDQVEAMTLANRIVVFHAGRIEQVGTPMELYHHPANLFVAGFIGSPKMNFISATLESAAATEALLRLADGCQLRAAVDATTLPAGTPVTLGVRPEHIDAQTAAPGNELRGTVQAAEHLGDATYLYVDVAGALAPVVVRASPDNPLVIGDTAHLGLPIQRCHVFDADGRALPRPR
jgi:multiple sugar transport system ATP-binding protein